MNNQQAGHIKNILQEDKPVPGCTISEQLYQQENTTVSAFTLAAGTSISAEAYQYHKIITVLSGTLVITTEKNDTEELTSGDSFITWTNRPVGIRTSKGCIYLETCLSKSAQLNPRLRVGHVFQFQRILPYQDNKIINMDLISDPTMKLVMMSFKGNTGLAEHSAPGKALIYALDGAATITYNGDKHTIKSNETSMMDKDARHAVKVNHQFKMILLVAKH
jgi:quercetin dioxygenase-like cupin family protein